MIPWKKLEKNIRGQKNCRDISRALYLYLQSLNVETKLGNWTEELQRDELYEYSRENAQIWNIVMETFDQMVTILGNNEVNLHEYARILEAGYKAFSVGIIPTTVDQVLIGSIQRSKNRGIKALFVLGVNDGILPAGKNVDVLFTEEDQNILKGYGIDWGADLNIKTEEECLAIYTAFSKPTDFLCLSYAIADHEGKAMRPSLLLGRLRSLFPNLRSKSDLIKNPEMELEHISTPGSSYKYLAENLRLYLDGKNIEEVWWDVYQWYYSRPDWDKSRNAMLEALFYQNQPACYQPSEWPVIIQNTFSFQCVAPGAICACPFAHFVRFGLKTAWREKCIR